MYSLHGYGEMIADAVRMAAYAKALRRAVRPGSVVLDLGAGTGIFACLACQYGAARVFAIEPSDALQVAREIAAANGFSDRIEFFQNTAEQVRLPRRVDVMVSDLRGILPLYERHLPAMADARRRFLAPTGAQIPQQDTLWAAVVSAPVPYRVADSPWSKHLYGLDMQAARRRTLNDFVKARLGPAQLLTQPKPWVKLDYRTLEQPDAQGRLAWTITRTGTGHGIALWFDSVLLPGIRLSNAPGQPRLIYGQAFFPWERFVNLKPGDRVEMSLAARLVADDYVWTWDTVIQERGRRRNQQAQFHQSTFYARPFSPARLRQHEAGFAPALAESGKIDLMILRLMDQGRSLGDIARAVTSRFPVRFPNWADAMARVGELSIRYGQ